MCSVAVVILDFTHLKYSPISFTGLRYIQRPATRALAPRQGWAALPGKEGAPLRLSYKGTPGTEKEEGVLVKVERKGR